MWWSNCSCSARDNRSTSDSISWMLISEEYTALWVAANYGLRRRVSCQGGRMGRLMWLRRHRCRSKIEATRASQLQVRIMCGERAIAIKLGSLAGGTGPHADRLNGGMHARLGGGSNVTNRL